MASDDYIRARIDPQLKAEGEAILERLGMSTSEALRVFWSQLVMRGGLPFDVLIPNAETRAAMVEDLSDAPRYSSAAEAIAAALAETDDEDDSPVDAISTERSAPEKAGA